MAVLMNLVLRIPVLNYFDDFGALVPFDLGPDALGACEKFSGRFGSPMKKTKSEVRNQIKFLGLLGSFPDPDYDMRLRITLPQDKIVRWSQIALDHATSGRISHKELEKLIGKLSYTQTSVVYTNLSFWSIWADPPQTLTRQTQDKTLFGTPQRSRT